ncbi:MAG: DUF4136 domain-containing protein [Gammaproteobacteria bacterium]|jgi:hypothetical protein
MLSTHRILNFFRSALLVVSALVIAACVTTGEQVETVGVKIDPSIIAVSTPGMKIPQGARFAWLESAINLYKDERMDTTTMQHLIEQNIKSNLAEMGFQLVDSETAADYTIAYTAALESSLDDTTILQRFGLVPGNMRIPAGDPMHEKGTLLIYVFDNRTGDMIWRSAVQAAVDFSIDNEERKERIEPIIRDMFRTMPTK